KDVGEPDYDHCLTIRTSMIGRELTGGTELLEWFLAQRGKCITAYRNALYSGLTTLTMAKLVRQIIGDYPQLNGKDQLAGPVITKYDVLCQLRDAFGIDVQIIPDVTFRCERTIQSLRFLDYIGMSIYNLWM